MFTILKCLKMIFLFKEVNNVYKNETGKEKPAFLTRRFIGSAIGSIGAAATLYTGVQFDAGLMAGIEEHVTKVTDTGYQMFGLIKSIVPDLIFLWGVLLAVIGYFKRERKPKP